MFFHSVLLPPGAAQPRTLSPEDNNIYICIYICIYIYASNHFKSSQIVHWKWDRTVAPFTASRSHGCPPGRISSALQGEAPLLRATDILAAFKRPLSEQSKKSEKGKYLRISCDSPTSPHGPC